MRDRTTHGDARAAKAARTRGRGRRAWRLAALASAWAVACSSGDAAGEGAAAQAALHDANGVEVGRAQLRDTPNGLLVELSVVAVPPGEHAFHIHETGKCEPPFASAGGHFAPAGSHHGFENPEGPHAGDLPNIIVPDSGRLQIDVVAPSASLAALLDEDGAALVIHQGADDYQTDPAGAAGPRIACGVIRPASDS